MQKRTDGRKFDFEPRMEDSLCTACGICTGSCVSSSPYRMGKEILKTGIEMPWYGANDLREKTKNGIAALTGDKKIIVYGCENGLEIHGLQDDRTATVQTPCSGMLPPSLLDYALKNGAEGVFVTGCREGDCFQRFGNTWTDARIAGEREPHLLKRTDKSKIVAFWGARSESDQLAESVKNYRDQIGKGEGS